MYTMAGSLQSSQGSRDKSAPMCASSACFNWFQFNYRPREHNNNRGSESDKTASGARDRSREAQKVNYMYYVSHVVGLVKAWWEVKHNRHNTPWPIEWADNMQLNLFALRDTLPNAVFIERDKKIKFNWVWARPSVPHCVRSSPKTLAASFRLNPCFWREQDRQKAFRLMLCHSLHFVCPGGNICESIWHRIQCIIQCL